MEDTSLESNEYQEIEEIPEFFQPGYVERVVDALPYYFPNYLKEKLKREHPDIPVTTRETQHESNPINYNRRDLFRLYDGGHLLNEMLVESLSLSMLKEINDYVDLDTDYMRNLFEPFLSDFGRNNTTAELIQYMQVALLSGDFRQTNHFLRDNFNISLYDFLNRFSKKVDCREYVLKKMKKVNDDRVGEFIDSPLSIYIWSLPQENLNSIYEILPTLNNLLHLDRLLLNRNEAKRDKEEINEMEEKKKSTYAIIAMIGIHETLHYLSYDPNQRRIGFTFDNQSDLYRLSRTY